MSIFERSKLPSLAGETHMFDDWLKYVVKYYSKSDLLYAKKEDNPLLTGLVYDFLRSNNVFLSTYSINQKNFQKFLEKVAPVITQTWDFSFREDPIDYRLLFDFSLPDLVDKDLLILNVSDMTVVMGSKLKYMEPLVQDSAFIELQEIVGAIMADENPGVEDGTLWICFHCYYGIYKTARSRVVPRPRVFVPPFQVKSGPIKFEKLEKFFDDLQKKTPDVSVRRQFCGFLGADAIRVFKRLGMAFPTIAPIKIPDEFGYLNVDYYKRIPTSGLNQEELAILSDVQKSVDVMCLERVTNNRRGTALRPLKYKIVDKSVRLNRRVNDYAGRRPSTGEPQARLGTSEGRSSVNNRNEGKYRSKFRAHRF
ncbi:ORF5 [Cnidium closterovirus 1]|nr:ORF5 [Cnidium closterovirus 1]